MQATVSNKYIIRSTAPIALALLIPLLSNLTNNYFLGQLGERELAVNGVAGLFYLILSMVGYGLASGIQVLLSRRAAKSDYDGIARALVNGGALTTFIALFLMICTLWMAPLIFGLSLHVDDHVVQSLRFIYTRVWGLPFLMLTQLSNAFYIATGRSRYLMAGSLVTTLINVVLDYTLIFGHFGAPTMGLKGAALASVFAEAAGLLVMWGLFFGQRLHIGFPVLQHLDLDFALCRRMMRVALPLVVQFAFSIGGWQIFFIFVEHLGEPELAASQILRPIFGIIGTATWAFGMTCNSMVSNIIGQGKTRLVPQLIRKVMALSFVTCVTLCGMLLLLGRPYLHLFTSDESLVALALPSLRIVVIATLIMSVASVMFNAVLGTGNTTVNLAIEVFCVSAYLVYCYFVIERARASLAWAWGAEFVYWTSLLICGAVYLKSGRWKGKVV